MIRFVAGLLARFGFAAIPTVEHAEQPVCRDFAEASARRPFAPRIFPELLRHRGPYPAEPSWMTEFGWIELTSSARPGWTAICETYYDVECVLKGGPKCAIYQAIHRGPPEGDHCPVLDRCHLAVGPLTGAIVVLTFPRDRSEKP